MKISSLSRGIWLALVAAAVVVPVSLGQAGRQQLGNSDQIEKEWKNISFDFKSQQATGAKPPVPKDIDTAAKYFIYRMTWDEGNTPLSKTIAEFNDIVDKDVNGKGFSGAVKGDNTEFKKQWSKALVDRARELTELALIDNARAILHGAQMFPAMARMKQEVVGVYLQELIDEKSPKPGHDAIRLHALRGLGDMLPVSAWREPRDAFVAGDKRSIEKKARDLARIDVLNRFIHRPAPTPPNPETLEAYRYVRREAIEALAKGGWPAVNSAQEDANSKMEGAIALTLMKVLVPGNLDPTPSLAERNEAAMGLCSIKGTQTYDGKPSLAFIAMTIVDMNRMYMEDHSNLGVKDKGSQSRFGWKIEGTRWKRALEILVHEKEGPFRADTEANRALAVSLASEKMAGGIIDKWMRHQMPMNALPVETFAKANLPAIGPLKIFKPIASPALNWNGSNGVDAQAAAAADGKAPSAGINPKE